jgi:shikimate dehydrogenase
MQDYSLYAVCGKPILHSKSPSIFRMLFKSTDYPVCYTRIASDNPKEILSIADDLGITGLNVTAPFKSEMFKLMDNCVRDSSAIGAVNTIVFKNGKKYGFNTDIFGVVETLKQNGIELEDKACLLVGYGNAAKAAAFGLTKEWKNVSIVVMGRSVEKAEEFAKKFEIPLNPPLENGTKINPYLIISTIPRNSFLDIREYLEGCEYFFDSAYPDSLMSREAKKYNCKIIPGEEWLLNQALASYSIFTGHEIIHFAQNDIREEILRSALNDKKNILMTGFSGSGKTSIGRLLAEKLGYLYFDTDKLIEERENLSINEIFRKNGETYFRCVETEVLERLCQIRNAVISCGGGTLCNSENFKIAQMSGFIVWLHVPLDKCLNRIDVKYKPMLNSRSMEEIENLYNERKILYCISSDFLVANTGEPSKAVENIIYELNMNENKF